MYKYLLSLKDIWSIEWIQTGEHAESEKAANYVDFTPTLDELDLAKKKNKGPG